jgi:hypothetical protein
MANVTVPITVSLRQETLTAFQEQNKDIPVGDWMGSKARQWFENFVNGAVFLTPDQTRKIEEMAGAPIASGHDIVASVAKGNGMSEDGERTFMLRIDPAFVGPLKTRADEMGITVEQLINDTWSMACDNNWAMFLEPEYRPPIFLPHYQVVQKLTGKDRPTGAEIEKAIGELVTLAKGKHEKPAPTPSEDGAEKGLIGNLMASLTGAK